MWIVLAILLSSLILCGAFVLGMLFARYMILDAQESAKRDRFAAESYALAGVRRPTDPKPYIPPKAYVSPIPRTPQRGILPGMGKLDRLMREGKRGTILWRPSDRKKAG